MKTLAVLLTLLTANVAVASEVGIENPQDVIAAEKTLALATAEKDASDRWANEPFEYMATAHQTAELNKKLEKLNVKIAESLETKLEQKLTLDLNL